MDMDTFSKYVWFVSLKNEKGMSIVNAFQKVLNKSRRKPTKIKVDKGSQFYNSLLKNGLILKCVRYITKENLFQLNNLLEL